MIGTKVADRTGPTSLPCVLYAYRINLTDGVELLGEVCWISLSISFLFVIASIRVIMYG